VPVIVFCPRAPRENTRKADKEMSNSLFGSSLVKEVDFINLI
jgi:hypothetical protein